MRTALWNVWSNARFQDRQKLGLLQLMIFSGVDGSRAIIPSQMVRAEGRGRMFETSTTSNVSVFPGNDALYLILTTGK